MHAVPTTAIRKGSFLKTRSQAGGVVRREEQQVFRDGLLLAISG